MRIKKLLLVTDAWRPQINGVVTSLEKLSEELAGWGVHVYRVSPDQFKSFPCPTYPEIRLSWGGKERIRSILDSESIDAIHIATEGPLGWAARNICLERKLAFTSAYHTRFPEYVEARYRIPAKWSEEVMRFFHAPSSAVMVSTRGLWDELKRKSYENLKLWSRGVDTTLFKPRANLQRSQILAPYCKDRFLAQKLLLYVGRVAVEKNIEDFLQMDGPWLKVVVGDGPQRQHLQSKFPDVIFTGSLTGKALAEMYFIADAFVFPSRTDTFGLVILEALSSGLPVAAYPVSGPKDILMGAEQVGVLDASLQRAVEQALRLHRGDCREFALRFSWKESGHQFLQNLVPVDGPRPELQQKFLAFLWRRRHA